MFHCLGTKGLIGQTISGNRHHFSPGAPSRAGQRLTNIGPPFATAITTDWFTAKIIWKMIKPHEISKNLQLMSISGGLSIIPSR